MSKRKKRQMSELAEAHMVAGRISRHEYGMVLRGEAFVTKSEILHRTGEKEERLYPNRANLRRVEVLLGRLPPIGDETS